MDEKAFSDVVSLSAGIAQQSKTEALRAMSKKIVEDILSWPAGVAIIAGVRGSGKTTILSELSVREKDSLFVNAEAIVRYGVSLLDFLRYAYTRTYRVFLLDEVHAFPQWEKDLKLFFDETKSKIIASGSSALALKARGSELSRRARLYETKPLSFREYLFFTTGKEIPRATLSELAKIERRRELVKEFSPYFKYYTPYVQFDALPAALFEKNPDVYVHLIERTIRYDLASIREIDAHYIEQAFRALKVIATSPPGELSYSGLASSLGIGIKLAREIIHSLEQTGILYVIPPFGTGKKAVRKEEKILMPLSFRNALCKQYGLPVPQGSIREDFFIQHVGKCFYLKSGKERRTPDFVVGDFIFEVGGPSKNFEQIKEKKNAFLVTEGLSVGEREIPLFLFGFLY